MELIKASTLLSLLSRNFSHKIHRKCKKKHFSISDYASVSTQTSVLIIGGYNDDGYNGDEFLSSIVEFKDDEWTVIGNLKQARHGHQAISIGSLVMIIGGGSNDTL